MCSTQARAGALQSRPAPRRGPGFTKVSHEGRTTMKMIARIAAATALAAALGISAAQATEITVYYPIAVGGPITKIFDGYAEAFHKAHPDITVKPGYTGTYQDSIVKAMTAAKAGNAPAAAVLLSTDMFTLIDNELFVLVVLFVFL